MEIAVAVLQIRCPACQTTDVMKQGNTAQGQQRYRCKNPSGPSQTFRVEYSPHGRVPAVKQHILERTLNGRGLRDIARVLPISPTTVMEVLRKRAAAPAHPPSCCST